MQNNQNYVYQLQNLLTQISNHVIQINEIIVQMNNIMTQINDPMINQMNNFMNSLNNHMNFGNQINYNNNININNPFKEINNDKINKNEIMNIGFIQDTGIKTFITVNVNQTINEIINLFLKKIGMPLLMNNYENEFFFLFNGDILNKRKEKRVKDVLVESCLINVLTKKLLCSRD